MNEADLILGKKKHAEMPTSQRTHFARYPARIRAICDAFIEEMGWTTDPTTKKIVAAGAKRFVDVHGNNPALLLRTIQQLRRNAPHIYQNIASPGSLITSARKMTPDGDSEEARQRYVTGEFADFFGEDDDD